MRSSDLKILVAGLCAQGLTGIVDTPFMALTVVGRVTSNAFPVGGAKWGGAFSAVRILDTRPVITGLAGAGTAGAGCDEDK